MNIGKITSKLATSVKGIAQTIKETSIPKTKSYIQHKANETTELAKEAYGRASVKLKGKTEITKDISKFSTTKLKGDTGVSPSSFISGSTHVFDKSCENIGSYGRNTLRVHDSIKFKNDLMEETIKKSDKIFYTSAKDLAEEAENGANAVISAMGERSGKQATLSALDFMEHGKTAIEKSLDEADEIAKKKALDKHLLQRKADLQAKYGEKLAKAKAHTLAE